MMNLRPVDGSLSGWMAGMARLQVRAGMGRAPSFSNNPTMQVSEGNFDIPDDRVPSLLQPKIYDLLIATAYLIQGRWLGSMR